MLRILIKTVDNMQEQVDNISREIQIQRNYHKEILEIKNININNIIVEFVSRLDMTGKTL